MDRARRNHLHFHSFRYFFKTIVTDSLNSDFAEALMGHKSLKLTYYKKNDEQRRQSYGKIEPYLTISDNTRVKETMDNMRQTIQKLHLELEQKQEEMKDIKTKLDELWTDKLRMENNP
jgi:hypothetical protein